jgi:hypothetical protein
MRRALTLLFCFTLLACLMLNTPLAKADSLGVLHVDGTEIKDSSGNVVLLNGVNLPWFTGDSDGSFMGSTTWSESNVAAEFAIMRSWGCNLVRLPIAVDLWKFNLNNGGQYMQYAIDRTLTIAENNGLYAWLDPHVLKSGASYSPAQDTYQNPLPFPPYQGADLHLTNFQSIIGSEAEYVAFMADLADKTKSHSNVLYGIWNEPVGLPADLEVYYDVAQDCITAIRATGATQIIFLAGNNWGSPDVDLAAPAYANGLDWFDDYGFTDSTGNLAIDAHNYMGHIHTGGSSSSSYGDLEDGLDYMGFFSQSVPILVGETGATSGQETYYDNFLNLLSSNGINFCGWVFSEQTSFPLHTGYPSCTATDAGEILQDYLVYDVEPPPAPTNTPIPPTATPTLTPPPTATPTPATSPTATPAGPVFPESVQPFGNALANILGVSFAIGIAYIIYVRAKEDKGEAIIEAIITLCVVGLVGVYALNFLFASL